MIIDLPPYDQVSGTLNVIVETPKGSRNKFKYDERNALYKLDKILPAGAVFPFDFGFIPSTAAGDGDPVDVLLLMDAPACTGCLVPARLVGVIEAEQTEKGRTYRNDRLVAVAVESRDHQEIVELSQLPEHLLAEIEHFFVSYHEMDGKPFHPLNRAGTAQAKNLIEQGREQYRSRHRDG